MASASPSSKKPSFTVSSSTKLLVLADQGFLGYKSKTPGEALRLKSHEVQFVKVRVSLFMVSSRVFFGFMFMSLW